MKVRALPGKSEVVSWMYESRGEAKIATNCDCDLLQFIATQDHHTPAPIMLTNQNFIFFVMQ